MIHRALFGSIERFFAILVEHYAGAFPAWLAPVQVVAVPVAEAFDGYLADVVDRLRAQGIRASWTCPTTVRQEDPQRRTQKVPFSVSPGETTSQRARSPSATATGTRTTGCRWRRRSADRRGGPGPSAGLTAMAERDDRRRFAGEPDGYERLWTPHRMVYIGGQGKPAGPGPALPVLRCRGAPRRRGGGRRARPTAFVVLNLYPYNSGHLMVVPVRHVADYSALTARDPGGAG